MQPLARTPTPLLTTIVKVTLTPTSNLRPALRSFSTAADNYKKSISQMFGDTKAQNYQQYLEIENNRVKMETTLVLG